MRSVTLPEAEGTLRPYVLGPPSSFALSGPPIRVRTAYAAVHVVMDPLRSADPQLAPAIDWDATLAYRHGLWSLGFGVAEAMDTSQRGMGLGWAGAKELIRRSLAEARSRGGVDIVCGAGTDQLDPAATRNLGDVRAAYEEQLAHIEACGGRAVLMASRALRHVARSSDDYMHVYGGLLAHARDPVILHWLGEAFDPQLAGYWGSDDVREAGNIVVGLIEGHRQKVSGVKISLLDAALERDLRARLPEDVKMYTGDDFNFVEMIEGDGRRFSHGLLGIFDPIAPAAAAAFAHLEAGDAEAFRRILAPTVPLSRRIFEAPTRFYKAGIVFLAWLNGHQAHCRLLGGIESARGIIHYAEIFRLADRAGLLLDPDRAAVRMQALAATYGID